METGEHSVIDHKWESELLSSPFGISYRVNLKLAEIANISLGCFSGEDLTDSFTCGDENKGVAENRILWILSS